MVDVSSPSEEKLLKKEEETMKAKCRNNKEHKEFVTVVHVTQEWIVNEKGEFKEQFDGGRSDVIHGPDAGNTWECTKCGAEAIVE